MKKDSLYKESFWYCNTYESLGSFWLINSLEALGVKKGYVFVNLSANAGYYERDVYKTHFDAYSPTYYVGDKEASNLKDKKVASFEQFYYIEGDNDAVTMDISVIPNKADIILDCKGALWYSLANKDNLIHLLENYSKLLGESGVLLIDYYKTNYIEYFLQSMSWYLNRYRNRKTKVDCFGELSTYSYMTNLYGKKIVTNLLIPLNVKKNKTNFPLAKIMDSAYIPKESLDTLIEITKNTPDWKFFFVKIKKYIKMTLFSLVFILILCAIFWGPLLFLVLSKRACAQFFLYTNLVR